jgi:hypothetical protein
MYTAASRIIMTQKNIIGIFLDDISKEFVLISQWGCDGSTGHGKYKQRSSEDISDSDIFVTSVIPLQSYSTKQLAIKLFFGKILGLLRRGTAVPSGCSLR